MSGGINSYAQVDRLVKRMKWEGAHPAAVATRRAEMCADVEAKYARRKRLAASVTVPDRPRLDAILADSAAAHGVDANELYDKVTWRGVDGVRCGRAHPVTCARRAFVVAARVLGYSSTELAMYLRRPGAHSSILYMEQAATDDDRAVASILLRRDDERRERAKMYDNLKARSA